MKKQTGKRARARRARKARRDRDGADPAEHPSIQRLEQGAKWVRAADKARARRAAAAKSTKKSEYVAFGIVGALALACCGTATYEQFFQRKRCIDQRTQQVIENSYCGSGGGGVGRWYYGGGGGSRVGEKVTGGSFSRGGFGRFVGGGS
ncbi:hypothetical protein GCM10009682_06660 [Luedemannella flava]|uniref:Transmembrane protein n=1 Tax=Luedemannella flava TaxID=349316 RepID=A0ABN2LFW9_9ACTN